MRKRLIAGNWKMNMHWNEAMTLISELVQKESEGNWRNTDVTIIPPSIYSRSAFEFLKNSGSKIELGAQNVAATENGAFTGEVSASMFHQIGTSLVLVGHSERREYFAENDEALVNKIRCVLDQNLTPLFCCGEHLDHRNSGNHESTILHQLESVVFEFTADEVSNMIIAYEPKWAIGTGETASPQQAQEMHAFIRTSIQKKFGNEVSNKLRILYGGSMNPENAAELLAQPDVDGGLIGGASIDANKFQAIIEA